MEQFLNCMLLVDTGATGVYRGRVDKVSSEYVTLKHPTLNGVKQAKTCITLHRSCIQDLSFIEEEAPASNAAPSVQPPPPPSSSVTQQQENRRDKLRQIPGTTPVYVCQQTPVAVPRHSGAAGRASHRLRCKSVGEMSWQQQQQQQQAEVALVKPQPRYKQPPAGATSVTRKPRLHENRNSTTFDTSACNMAEDFDFESNLAMFDKRAVFEAIDRADGQGGRAAPVKTSYQHHENVLQLPPRDAGAAGATAVPSNGAQQHVVTDAGWRVPLLPAASRERLLTAAWQLGLDAGRQAELFARPVADLVMQQMGGATRLRPDNRHQLPAAVVLVGPGRRGQLGVAVARHLALHEVRVWLLCQPASADLQPELRLFRQTDGVLVHTPCQLPAGGEAALDFVLVAAALGRASDEPLRSWCAAQRAAVWALDPPGAEEEEEGGSEPLSAAAHVQPGLPVRVSARLGRSYLCDLGLSPRVFQEAGVEYCAPFGHKSLIGLHEPPPAAS